MYQPSKRSVVIKRSQFRTNFVDVPSHLVEHLFERTLLRKGWGRCIEGGICETERVGRSALAAMGVARGVGDGKALAGV